ncbi:MAG: 16S rRNA (guanine(527)-N(7))-methyltransferase RsmG [Nitrospirota bacterium]|nr:16S rRNA (guanine(527)-N(7))-methyltransferase RsmG [Nitrospirota bacterium]
MSKAADLLRAGMEELGIHCTEDRITAFITYLDLLKKWNRAYNLTGLKTEREIIIKHFLDSLLFSKVIPSDARSIADIGSGAGFPGIPIRIINPRLRLFLVEPAYKKQIFLRHVTKTLHLQEVEVINSRIEEIKGLKVDVAVTRALFSVGDFIDKAGDILNKNGILILSKGPKLDEELRKTEQENISTEDFRLPFENIVRHIVVVKKTEGKTP